MWSEIHSYLYCHFILVLESLGCRVLILGNVLGLSSCLKIYSSFLSHYCILSFLGGGRHKWDKVWWFYFQIYIITNFFLLALSVFDKGILNFLSMIMDFSIFVGLALKIPILVCYVLSSGLWYLLGWLFLLLLLIVTL